MIDVKHSEFLCKLFRQSFLLYFFPNVSRVSKKCLLDKHGDDS